MSGTILSWGAPHVSVLMAPNAECCCVSDDSWPCSIAMMRSQPHDLSYAELTRRHRHDDSASEVDWPAGSHPSLDAPLLQKSSEILGDAPMLLPGAICATEVGERNLSANYFFGSRLRRAYQIIAINLLRRLHQRATTILTSDRKTGVLCQSI
jgi:hypothetical protein